MGADPLSDVLSLVKARCVISGGFSAAGEWGLRFRPPHRLKLHAAMRGTIWVLADDHPPLRLGEGDVLVLNGASTFTLASSPHADAIDAEQAFLERDEPIVSFGGTEVLGIGGHVELDATGRELILGLLPPITRVSADGSAAADLRPLLRRLLDEISQPGPGSDFAAEQHAQLVLLTVLRAAIAATDAPPPGWLRLLGDAELRPALHAIHRDPAYPWRLTDLAREVSMSRSGFATRFRAAAGESPIAYLNRWRIRLAQATLRDTDRPVARLASDLGYASESSFSHAFKRATTVSPRAYRVRQRVSSADGRDE